ncbi:MAG TPA: 1,2-phenylacetyl-CoA epoxidase subunit PaaC [Burkholderiales bacterium]|nr:1,2-phenylacetyl-CoA epoxidase subunit PaaC [Burkholderiales bacterium]
MSSSTCEFALRMGDNALILGQRLGEWLGHGPQLEEDIASANIALDLVGQARLWLSLAGRLEGRGRDEDALAYARAQHEFRNCTLVELPNGDYAFTIVRRMLFDAYQRVLLGRLAGGAQAEIAAIAAKSKKEADYHWRHSADWTLRFGDGTDESHRRAQGALDRLWGYTRELFVPDPVDPEADSLRGPWLALVEPLLKEATLAIPAETKFISTGKRGLHSEHLGYVLAEMQFLQRAYPGAKW